MTLWTQQPEAARLLADLTANPPRQRYARGILGPSDGGMIYDDDRYRRLQALYMDEQVRVDAECRKLKDHSAFYAITTPQDALDGASSTQMERDAA